MVDFILGLGLALPVLTSTSTATVTGITQGIAEQKKCNSATDDARWMLKFHLDVIVEDQELQAEGQHWPAGSIVILHNGKLWLHSAVLGTRKSADSTPHPFTGFYLAYPDSSRPDSRGLVSTISQDPPMLNWIYIDRDTYEVKYGSRSGSISHHIGSYGWTDNGTAGSCVTFHGWEGFLAVKEDNGRWALYFDLDDDGLSTRLNGKQGCEVSLQRRLVSAQEVNKWDVRKDSNIGFRASEEVHESTK